MRKNLASKIALTGLLTVTAGGGVIAPIASQVFTTASAADVASTNVTGSKSIADGTHVAVAKGGFNVTLNWSIPNGTKENDTTHITLNDKIKGVAFNNGQIKTDAGDVIGTVNGSGNSYTVTYTNFVETHTNVSATVKLAVDGNGNTWGPSGSTQSIDATVDGSKVDLGNFIYDYTSSVNWGATGALQPNDNTPEADLTQKLAPGQFTESDVGKTFEWAGTIDKDDQQYAVYDCDKMKSNDYGMNYALFGPDATTGERSYAGSGNSNGAATAVDSHFTGTKYDLSATPNPFAVKLVSCTPEKVVYEYTVPKEAVGMQAQFNAPINLTAKAIAEQFVGPYNGGVDVYAKDGGTPNENGFGYGMWTNYTFTDAQGAGTVTPKAADDTVTTKKNTKVNIKILENDSLGKGVKSWKSVQLKDATGNPVSNLKTSDGEYTTLDDKTVDFMPAKDFVGVIKEPVIYIATDENDQKAEAKMNITVEDVSTPDPTPTTDTPTPTTDTPTPTTTSDTPTSTSTSSTPTSTSDSPTVTPTTDTPTVTPTTDTPAPVVTPTPTQTTVTTDPVVGPKVQTDYVGGSSAVDIAGVSGLVALMGLGAFKAGKKK